MPRALAIIRRLDAALAKVAATKTAVRAIYLTEKDWDKLNHALGRAWGSPLVSFQYQGHEIRRGKASRIYTQYGVGVSVPKKPPPCAC